MARRPKRRGRAARSPLDRTPSRQRVRKLLERALDAHRAGDGNAAAAGYRAVIEADPDNAPALHHLGLLAIAAGRAGEALPLLSRAAKADPRDASVRNNLGNLLRESGRLDEAAMHYARALALQPGHEGARFNLGKCLHGLDRLDEAADALRALTRRSPGDADAWTALGLVEQDRGHVEAAREAHEQALAIAPRLADAHNNLGLLEMDLGDFEAAERRFRAALDADPSMAVAHANLARTRRFEAGDEGDVERLEHALAAPGLAPENASDLHFALGKAYDDLGRPDAAFAHYRTGNDLRARITPCDADAAGARTARLVAAFDADFLARAPRGDAATTGRPVFIVGMPRSGTTLVEQIVASHPDAAAGGELSLVARLAAGLGAAGAGFPEAVHDLDAEAFEQIGARYLSATDAAAAGHARLTDKMPANYLYLGLIALALPGARIVHCVRDPLDVCLSIYFRPFTHDDAYAYANRLPDIAAEYRAYHELMAHWRAVLPGAVHEVRYETLVREQESTSRALIDHLGLDWHPECLAFHRTKRPVHTASNWQVRQPLYDRSLERWRKYEAHLGPLFEALGDLAERPRQA